MVCQKDIQLLKTKKKSSYKSCSVSDDEGEIKTHKEVKMDRSKHSRYHVNNIGSIDGHADSKDYQKSIYPSHSFQNGSKGDDDRLMAMSHIYSFDTMQAKLRSKLRFYGFGSFRVRKFLYLYFLNILFIILATLCFAI